MEPVVSQQDAAEFKPRRKVGHHYRQLALLMEKRPTQQTIADDDPIARAGITAADGQVTPLEKEVFRGKRLQERRHPATKCRLTGRIMGKVAMGTGKQLQRLQCHAIDQPVAPPGQRFVYKPGKFVGPLAGTAGRIQATHHPIGRDLCLRQPVAEKQPLFRIPVEVAPVTRWQENPPEKTATLLTIDEKFPQEPARIGVTSYRLHLAEEIRPGGRSADSGSLQHRFYPQRPDNQPFQGTGYFRNREVLLRKTPHIVGQDEPRSPHPVG